MGASTEGQSMERSQARRATAVIICRRGTDYSRAIVFQRGEDLHARSGDGMPAILNERELNQAAVELALADSGCRSRGCSSMQVTRDGLCEWCRQALSDDLPYVLGEGV